MKKFWRWLLASVVVIIFSLAVQVSRMIIFAEHGYYYATPDIFLGLIFPLFYVILYQGIPGKGIIKGLVLGMLCWLLFFLPHNAKGIEFSFSLDAHLATFGAGSSLSNLSSFNVVKAISYLLGCSLGGIVIAFIFGKSLEVEKANAGTGV
ncbi:MAG TPA: hypothetical protein VGB16_00350 [candidate division Zixibacteria bacterium]